MLSFVCPHYPLDPLLGCLLLFSGPHEQEVNELKATVEKAKNDVIKTVIGVLGTFSAIAFTISRLVTLG